MVINIYSKKHDKTGKHIWVVKPKEDLPREEFSLFRKELGKLGGKYSRFVSGMVFHLDPTQALKDFYHPLPMVFDLEQIEDPDKSIGKETEIIKDPAKKAQIKATEPAPPEKFDPQDWEALKDNYADPNKQYKAQGKDGTDFILMSAGVSDAGEFRYSVVKPAEDAGTVIKFSPAAVQINVWPVSDTNWEEILFSLITPAQLSVESHDLQVNQERLIKQLQQMPPIYGTQDTPPGEIVAYQHYFGGGVDLYITEFGPPNDLYVYGSFIEGGGFEGSYWYIDQGIVKQLPALVNLDYYWKPMQLKDIDDSRNPHFKKPEDPSSKQTKEMEVIIADNYSNQYEVNKAIEGLLDKLGPEFNAWTPDAINFLQRYSGYGGLGEFMDPEKDIGIIKGTLSEYYTPDPIIKKMWGLAYKYGFTEAGTVLEPSCGVGRFIKYAPVTAMVKAYEINKYSARIADASYRAAQVLTTYFESEFYFGHGGRQINRDYEGSFDLVIGNAPFGNYEGPYAGMGEKKYSGATQVDHHFLVRGLDALKPGGLLIMIVSSRFMSGGHDKVKALIETKGDLIDAYRLPTGIFQNTGVNADILIFRRQSETPVGTVHIVRPSHGEEPVKEEFTPRDGWRDNLIKAREYAAAIIPKEELDLITRRGVLDWSDTESIVKAIDTHLASLQRGVTQPAPAKPAAQPKPTKPAAQPKPTKPAAQPAPAEHKEFDALFIKDFIWHTEQADWQDRTSTEIFAHLARRKGISDAPGKELEFIKVFFESPLPGKVFKKKHKLWIDDIKGEIHVHPIAKIPTKDVFREPFDDLLPDQKRKALSTIVSTDGLRPNLTGVLNDPNKNLQIATDANNLVTIKTPNLGRHIKEPEVITLKGEILKVKFPETDFLFQTECQEHFDVNIHDWYPIVSGVLRANKFTETYHGIKLRLDIDDAILFFNPQLLWNVLEVFRKFAFFNLKASVCLLASQGSRFLKLEDLDDNVTSITMEIAADKENKPYTILNK
jgi:hypothetical protein